jgi:hypothetical protein
MDRSCSPRGCRLDPPIHENPIGPDNGIIGMLGFDQSPTVTCRSENCSGIEGRVFFFYHLTAIPNISKCAPPNSGPDPKNALGGSSFEK